MGVKSVMLSFLLPIVVSSFWSPNFLGGMGGALPWLGAFSNSTNGTLDTNSLLALMALRSQGYPNGHYGHGYGGYGIPYSNLNLFGNNNHHTVGLPWMPSVGYNYGHVGMQYNNPHTFDSPWISSPGMDYGYGNSGIYHTNYNHNNYQYSKYYPNHNRAYLSQLSYEYVPTPSYGFGSMYRSYYLGTETARSGRGRALLL